MINEERKIILLGSGGHAKGILEILRAQKLFPSAIFINKKDLYDENYFQLKPYYRDSIWQSYNPDQYTIIIGVGRTHQQDSIRNNLFKIAKNKKFYIPALCHSSAKIAEGVKIYSGSQIMMGACIQPGVRVHSNVVINTSASIDHDVVIRKNVFIGPGVIICGNVEIGENSYIGAGSVVVPNTKIPCNSFFKAQSLIK